MVAQRLNRAQQPHISKLGVCSCNLRNQRPDMLPRVRESCSNCRRPLLQVLTCFSLLRFGTNKPIRVLNWCVVA